MAARQTKTVYATRMSLLQLLILSVIQGVTEWLPISSSAHLLLAADWFGITGRDELLVNAMAHLGTLFAILAYFWRDVTRAIRGGLQLLTAPFTGGDGLSADATLAWHIIIATPIALAAGLAITQMPDSLRDTLRSPLTVASSTIIFALALWWADSAGSKRRTETDRRWTDALIIGATQAIAALIPGTSRSGITMTAARALGFERTEAARFAMLIGAPILAAGGLYAFYELFTGSETSAISITDSGLIILFSFISGFLSIWALMALLKRMSFLPFVIYRLILGAALFVTSPYAAQLFAG